MGETTQPFVIRNWIQEAAKLPRGWREQSDRFQVALADGVKLTRTRSVSDLNALMLARPQTRLYESVHCRRGEWQATVASLLAGWMDSDVLCSVYEANVGDSALPEHRDAWDNVVVQLSGTKRWFFSGGQEIVLSAGDVLAVPEGVGHLVRTDFDSVHLNFELVRPEIVASYLSNSVDAS